MPVRPTIAALIACGVLLGPSPAPGQSETFGLDLSTPESAAASFVETWAKGDYIGTYMAAHPHLRFRFNQALNILDPARILAQSEDPDTRVALFDMMPEWMVDHTYNHQPSLSGAVDIFAYFQAMMNAAAVLELLPFSPSGAATRVVIDDGPADNPTARAEVAAEDETLTLHLVQSPAGHWRVSAVESDTRDLPLMWLPLP